MSTLFFILILFLYLSKCSTRTLDTNIAMVAFRGNVVNNSECVHLDAELGYINYQDCILACANRIYCLAAEYIDNECCFLCPIGSVTEVYKDSKEENYVGLKMIPELMKNEQGEQTCPVASYQYEFKHCPHDWVPFMRPVGVWCIGSFSLDNMSNFNATVAEDICKNQSAIVSGLETSKEREYITDKVFHQRQNAKLDKDNAWGVWVNGRRQLSCENKKSNNCKDGFRLTDHFLDTNSGYEWVHGEPEAGDLSEDCLYIQIRKNASDSDHGKIDDISCNSTKNTYLKKAVICGKVPE